MTITAVRVASSPGMTVPAHRTWLERNVFVVLALLSVAGILMILIGTRWGVGIKPDSTVYIGTARSLLAGGGLIVPFAGMETTALTLHAPLFPTLLAGLGVLGVDPLDGARWLNMVLFGANILLVGYVLYRVTGGASLTAIFGSVLLLTCVDIVRLHSVAATEPLFYLVSLLGVFLLAGSYERPWLLPASAASVALATLTRYPGVALIVAGVVVLLLFDSGEPYRKRLAKAAIFAVISTLPIGLWVLRNLYVGGSAGGRELAFHPITIQHIVSALFNMSAWLVPPRIPGVPGVARHALVLAVVAAGLLLGVVLARQRREDGSATAQPFRAFPALLVAFIASYAALLVVYITFLDQWRGALDQRIVSVIFTPSLLLVLLKGNSLLRAAQGRWALRTAVLLLCLAFAGTYMARAATVVARNHADGVDGYTSKRWRESEAIKWLKDFPAGVKVYSNGADAIYILSGRLAERIPLRVRPMSGFVNTNFASQLAAMEEQLQAGRAILVYFHTITHRWYLPSEAELASTLRLRLVQRTADAAVYAGHRAP